MLGFSSSFYHLFDNSSIRVEGEAEARECFSRLENVLIITSHFVQICKQDIAKLLRQVLTFSNIRKDRKEVPMILNNIFAYFYMARFPLFFHVDNIE